MAQADTIREFLVKLGFKVDEAGLKKFTGGVEGATAGVSKLVSSIAGAALVVSAGVAAFASNMEALYFAAKKTGSSATNLKAFEKAAINFGAASGEALSSVQSLARFMRETPGAEGFLKSLGVDARDANGNLRDTSDIMSSLGGALRNKPYYLARQYASMFGISEDVLRAMLNGDFDREMEKQRELLKDSGYQEAAEKAHAFMVRLRELQTRIEALGVAIGGPLLDAFETVGDFALPLLGKIAEGWKLIYELVKSAGKAINDFMPTSWSDKIGAGTSWLLDKLGIKGAADRALGLDGGTVSAKPGSALSYFMSKGWTKDQSAGIVANLNRESNMNPRAVGDNGSAYGIAQWHPDRQANFAKWAGKDIRQSTVEEQMAFVHYELTQGSDAKAGALLRATTNAQQAGETVSRYYERPGKADAEAALRGKGAVSIAHQTTINVNGGDAAATGRAVANEQTRVYQDVQRNAKLGYQ